jgi:hypothetical protein
MAGPTDRKAVEYFFAEIAQLPDGTYYVAGIATPPPVVFCGSVRYLTQPQLAPALDYTLGPTSKRKMRCVRFGLDLCTRLLWSLLLSRHRLAVTSASAQKSWGCRSTLML